MVDEDDDMGMTPPRYHMSEKILGQLFRSIDEKKIWKEDIHPEINTAGPSVWDQLIGLVESQIDAFDLDIDYTRRYKEAWRIRNL